MPIAQSVLLLAGEFFAASFLAMLLARAAAAASPARAALRHLIWLAAFAALLALPLWMALLPGQLHIATAPQAGIAAASAPAAAMPPGAVPAPQPAFALEEIVVPLVALWLAGVLAILARGAIAWIGLVRLHASSAPFAAVRPAFAARCEIALSAAANEFGPITWGVLRPVILLPSEAQAWPAARLDAVLLHEMAHVRRGDCLWQALAWIVCAFYWPNPLIWFGAGALRAEAEMAADDAVLAAGTRASSYASELLDIASGLAEAQFAQLPMAMAAPSALHERIAAILSPQAVRTGVSRMDILKVSASVLLASSAIVLARPAFAQDVPPPPPAPIAADAAPAAPPAPMASAIAPPAPLAAPADPVALAPPAEPAPPPASKHNLSVRREVRTENGQTTQRVWVSTDGEVEKEVSEAMAKAQPEIERAMLEVQRARPELEKAMAKLKDLHPQLEKAMAEMKEQLAKANVRVKVQRQVDDKLGRTELRIVIEKAPKDGGGAPAAEGTE